MLMAWYLKKDQIEDSTSRDACIHGLPASLGVSQHAVGAEGGDQFWNISHLFPIDIVQKTLLQIQDGLEAY